MSLASQSTVLCDGTGEYSLLAVGLFVGLSFGFVFVLSFVLKLLKEV